MEYDPEKHHRRSIRLREYDYTTHGAYFVTICTYKWLNMFGKLRDGAMRLNSIGEMAADCWSDIPNHFEYAGIDLSVVMPNHFHGIFFLVDHGGEGTACRAPTVAGFGKPMAGSLSTVVRSFKSAVTKQVNLYRKSPGSPVWQRNYYERVIRDEDELNCIRQYILDNPLHWDMDRNNPRRTRPLDYAPLIWEES